MLTSVAGRLFDTISGENAESFLKYDGDDPDLVKVKQILSRRMDADTELDVYTPMQNNDPIPIEVVMPGTTKVEQQSQDRSLDATLRHMVTLTRDLGMGSQAAGESNPMKWIVLKHAITLLEYSDGNVDITDFAADVRQEGQNFVKADGTVAERAWVRYAPAETPLAAYQAPPPAEVANFGLPAVHAFPTGHFPVNLFDFTGEDAPTWTRGRVKSAIARLTGNDEGTQANVEALRQQYAQCEADNADIQDAKKMRDKGIREAYNSAGFPRRFEGDDAAGWLFVRYHNRYLNCQHYQEAIAGILSNTDVSTANLTFRLFGQYQRLAMEEDGESHYVM